MKTAMKRWRHNIDRYSRFLYDENYVMMTIERPNAARTDTAGSCRKIHKSLLNNRDYMAIMWRQVRAEMRQFLAKNDTSAP